MQLGYYPISISIVSDDNKRKREEDPEEVVTVGETFMTLMKQVIKGIADLSKTIASAPNTKRDVLNSAS